jgi:hypothetical protein
VRTEAHAVAAEHYGTFEATQRFAKLAEQLYRPHAITEVIIKQGLTTQEGLDTMLDAMHAWAERPDAFLAWMYCAGLGWVAEETD